MQSALVAGDTLAFDTSAPIDAEGNAYKASDGWSMSYRLVPRSASAAVVTISASADGDDFTVAVPSSTTALWTAGWYSWAGYVTKSGNRYTFGSGEIEIKADPGAVAAGHDARSHARKVLDAIEAVLESRATVDQKRVVINGRELERFPITDLLKLRDLYRAEVRGEENAARLAAGLAAKNRIYVRR